MGKNNHPVIQLKIDDIPSKWYNCLPDLPEAIPPLKDSGRGESEIERMKKIRPAVLIEQDTDERDRFIDIPGEVLERYVQIGRPTVLKRAVYLEKYLNTPAKIFFKREDMLTMGSFKLNSSIPQAYYSKKEGRTHLVTETGAGQWGVAVANAGKFYNLKSTVFMAKCSYESKPYRQVLMRLFGTEVYPSPSGKTKAGRDMLEKDPNHTGSIGSAISEAIELSTSISDAAYLSGSNLNHVLMHQSIIGQEVKKQMELIGEKADELIACVSGGSNLGGLMLPFLPDKLGGDNLKFIAVESNAAPRLTKGEYRYDHGDPAGLTPLSMSYTLGMDYVPPAVHVGGLRQHSGSPLVGLLRKLGMIDARTYDQDEAFKAGRLFLETEGILPAPETCHTIAAVIESAVEAREKGISKNIVFCFSGNGFLDLHGYDDVLLKSKGI
ncbi:MAG TPA: TrpB-like pyridoxal phosphate-dependent enzyme [Clostridia bacterium]